MEGEVKNIGEIVKQAQKVQAQIMRMKDELAKRRVEATAGGGMVKAIASGNGEITSIEIEPEIILSGDRDMLQDLIVAAVNEALRKAKELAAEELSRITKGINIPGLF